MYFSLSKEEVKEILMESNIVHLFSQQEIDLVVEDIYNRYCCNNNAMFPQSEGQYIEGGQYVEQRVA